MSTLAPGMIVRHPSEPGWGLGQVQTVIGGRVTVNFEHCGKCLINIDVISLTIVDVDGKDRQVTIRVGTRG